METLNRDPRFDGHEKKPEFKNGNFSCELLNEREPPCTVRVEYESYKFNGEFRIVYLEIVGGVDEYTLDEVKDILTERLGRVFVDCTPILKTK